MRLPAGHGQTAHIKDASAIRHGSGKRKGLVDLFRFELQESSGREGASYGQETAGKDSHDMETHGRAGVDERA